MQQNTNEVNSVKPSSLSHLIGQSGVIEQLKVAIDASQMDGNKLEDAILLGPPGMGKSATAQIISQEMATDFHEVLGQSITSASDLNQLLLSAKDKDIVHIDECHQLGKEFQTALYLAIDQRRLIVNGGKKPQSIPIANFTLLLSTTDEYGLLQPLRDRMKLTLRFDYYSEEELAQVLYHRVQGLGWSVHENVFMHIAKRSRGTPRIALRLLQSCRRVCRANGERTTETRHLVKACELEGIDEMGLGPVEQNYLRIVGDGANRLNVIASMTGLPAKTISDVAEPFLMRIGLLIKDDQGKRQLSEKGREHLSNSCPHAV